MDITNKQKQMQLKYLGYYKGKIDGSFGPASKNATKAFQKYYKLKIDGSFGIKTINKSLNVYKDIQAKLNRVGNKLRIDGYVGALTINAVKRFQKNKSLVVSGVLNYSTILKLNQSIINIITTETVCNFDLVKNFKRSEFKCGCKNKYCSGFPVEMKQQVVNVVQRARTYFKASCTVSSGVRCQRYNDSLKGSVKNSMHLKGKAIDCRITGVSGTKLKAFLSKQKEVKYTYVINGDWVHVNIY